MTDSFEEWLHQKTHSLSDPSLRRTLHPICHQQGSLIRLNDTSYISFTSNDYLGLSQHEDVLQSYRDGIARWGAGSGGSRVLGGDREVFHILESRLASLTGQESALVFNSGYQANVGIVSALLTEKDVIYADKKIHASILDGARLSKAKLYRFAHHNTTHLKEILTKTRDLYANALIVTESVFSMDGDFCDIQELVHLKEAFQTWLMIDEAHAFGIYGKRYQGRIDCTQWAKSVDVTVGAFGKAVGTCGGFVSGTRLLKEWLIQACRSFLFSTAYCPAIAAATLTSLDILAPGDLQGQLAIRVASFKEQLTLNKIPFLGQSHIIGVVIGDEQEAMDVAQYFQNNGLWVQAIRHPTVAKGEARLRLVITAMHTQDMIDRLITILCSPYVREKIRFIA